MLWFYLGNVRHEYLHSSVDHFVSQHATYISTLRTQDYVKFQVPHLTVTLLEIDTGDSSFFSPNLHPRLRNGLPHLN